MLSFDELQQKVTARFSDAKTIENGVIRFVRKLNDHPFAVCYLALDADLPNDEQELTQYQDRVVGGLYFEGATSLQWSNYLYFITSTQRLGSQKVQRAKEFIERNRSYARKFVVSDRELDQILAPPVATPEGAATRPNVISVWTQALAAQGLDKAIFSDEGMPSRLAMIESTEPSDSAVKLPAPSPKSPPPAFLDRLQLSKYRPYPLNRDFDFGTMNLVFGPNAAGKTSLLEAIELLYCGRNKRNEDKPTQYEIIARYRDGKTEKASPGRALKVFRDRNLAWYGQPEVLTNNLYQSFSKFNFLDTDAAVRIAESTEDIDQDLSKLLIGPDASRIWDNMGRVQEALESRLRDQKRLGKQLDDELAELVKRLEAIAGLKRESDSIDEKLREMLHRLRWLPDIEKFDEKAAGRVVSSLAELLALAEQATSLGWIKSPITLSSLAKYTADTNAVVRAADASIQQLEVVLKNQRAFEESIKRQNEVSALLAQLRLLVEAQVHVRAGERTQCEKDVATNTALLAGFDAAAFDEAGVGDVDSKVTLADKHAEIARAKAAALATLQKTRSEYTRFARLREQSLSLAQELREIAARIIEDSDSPDECPLCHTQFGEGKLAEHMNHGLDKHVEQTGQAILKRQRSEEAELNRLVSVEAVYAWLVKFCERASTAKNITVTKAVARLDEVQHVVSVSTQRLGILRREIATLEKRGLSDARLREIQSRLVALKQAVSPLTIEAVDEAIRKIKAETASITKSLQAVIKESRDRGGSLQSIFSAGDQSLPTLKSAISKLRETIALTARIEEQIKSQSEEFPWGNRAPLTELVVSANAVSSVAASLQTEVVPVSETGG